MDRPHEEVVRRWGRPFPPRDKVQEGMLKGFSLGNYLLLVDYAGRLFRDGKAAISAAKWPGSPSGWVQLPRPGRRGCKRSSPTSRRSGEIGSCPEVSQADSMEVRRRRRRRRASKRLPYSVAVCVLSDAQPLSHGRAARWRRRHVASDVMADDDPRASLPEASSPHCCATSLGRF